MIMSIAGIIIGGTAPAGTGEGKVLGNKSKALLNELVAAVQLTPEYVSTRVLQAQLR